MPMDAYCTQARSDVMTAARAGHNLWQSSSVLPSLPANTIHIWRLLPNARLATEDYAPYLRPEEQERAGRFFFIEDQRQSIATRATLRMLLAHYAAMQYPAADDGRELTLSLGEQGKPFLTGSSLCFNLSHTSDLAIFAFARSIELGVDVEHVRATGDLDEVAEQNFAPAERAALQALPPGERIAAFYRCWTRKEALLKAEGSGLFRALDSFAVPILPGAAAERLCDTPDGWEIAHLDVLPDAPGAIAWKHREPTPELVLFDWSPHLISTKT